VITKNEGERRKKGGLQTYAAGEGFRRECRGDVRGHADRTVSRVDEDVERSAILGPGDVCEPAAQILNFLAAAGLFGRFLLLPPKQEAHRTR
jgi:hypothetical protein